MFERTLGDSNLANQPEPLARNSVHEILKKKLEGIETKD